MKPELEQYIARRRVVLDRIRTMLVQELGVRREPRDIDPDTPLFGTGLGLDSVDAMDLVVGLEARFGLSFPSNVHGQAALRTVNGLVDFVLAEADGAAQPSGADTAQTEGG